jgi:ferrous-iron efflux pump FieF
MLLINNNTKLKNLAVIFGVLLSITLILVKLFAFLKSGSLAIFSSLVDSVTDFFASTVSFLAVYFSSKPASINHRYGYGKTEALSALLQALFVGTSGLFVIIDGIKRLINPVEINQIDVAIYIMIFSIVSTLFLVLFQTYVAKKTNSLAIKADRAHYVVDFLTNLTVIVSLVCVHFFGFYFFDVIAGLFISIYLLYNAYSLAKESIDLITDRELSDDIRKNVEHIVLETSGVLGMHDFRSRSLGDVYFIELHLEMDGNISLSIAHDLTNTVERRIIEAYPNSQILIHQDPFGVREDRIDHQINGVCTID